MIRYKFRYYTRKVPFRDTERTFQVTERPFQVTEYTFRVTEWNFSRYVDIFFLLSKPSYASFSFFLKLRAMLQTPTAISGRLSICPMSIGKPASNAT